MAGTTSPSRDAHPWRLAVILTGSLIAVAMAWSCAIGPALHGSHGWVISNDVWYPLQASHYIANGAFPALYEASPEFVYLPGLPIVLTPLAAVGQWLQLSESIPAIVVPQPQMWLLLGPYGVALAIIPLAGFRRVVATCRHRALAAPQIGIAAVSLTPVAIVWGHYEELLSLGLVLFTVVLISDGRPIAASAALAGAVLSKQTALLAAPVLLFQVPPGPARRRAIAISLGLPAAVAGLCLTVDWPHASRALLRAPSAPHFGRKALWLTSSASSYVATPTRIMVVLVAVALGYGFRHQRSLAVMLAGVAATATLRLVAEPVLFSYYLGAPVVLVVATSIIADRPWWPGALAGALGVLMFLIQGHNVLWWVLFGGIIAVLGREPLSVLNGRMGQVTRPGLSSQSHRADVSP